MTRLKLTLATAGTVLIAAASWSTDTRASQQQPGRDAATTKPAVGTAAIIGTVVTDDPSGRPLRRVTITMSAAGATMSVQRLASTDDAGRFVFRNLPAGNYTAPRAVKPGFVPVVYGQKRVGGIGTPISLADGQVVTVALKMLRGAVITGTILDDRGRPLPQVSVQAMPMRVAEGVRTAAPNMGYFGSVTTDDRGTYRIYGLSPGDYVVSASPRLTSTGEIRPVTAEEMQWAQQQLKPSAGGAAPMGSATPPRPAQAVSYAPIYYPGTTNPDSAALITLAAGEERPGVDFSAQYVPTAKIEGTVVDAEGGMPQNVQVNIVSRANSPVLIDSLFLFESMMLSRPTAVNGKFSIPGVRPGEYTITARAAPNRSGGPGVEPQVAAGRGAPPAPMTLWATADITVDGNDQSGITLRVRPGMTLSGRIAFDGTTLQPPPDLSRVMVRLSAAPTAGGVTVSVGVPSAQVSADGTFRLVGVTPGRYLLSASAPPATPVPGSTWLVRSAMANNVDVADLPLEVHPDQDISNIVVTFTDKAAEVSGTLLDAAGRPTPEFSIIVFSTDRKMWQQRSRRLRPPVRPGTDGKFRIPNLLAGEYFVAALTDFEPADVYNPAFLEQVAAAGAIKITLGEGEKKVQDLRVAGGS